MTIVTIFIILLLGCIYYIQKEKLKDENNKKEYLYITSETETDIEYVTQIYRVDRKNGEYYLPYIGKDDFFLRFFTRFRLKEGNFIDDRSYTMQVSKDSIDGYITRLRMDKRCVYNNYRFHCGASSEEWSYFFPYDNTKSLVNGNYYNVLSYYFTHKSQIPVLTQPVNISYLNPLFTIYDEDSHQQKYVMQITKEKDYGGKIYCDVLTIMSTSINGELESYLLSNYSLSFRTYEGKEYEGKYYVKICLNSTKLYSPYNNEEGEEIKIEREEDKYKNGWSNEIDFSHKVREYYQAHKSEIKIEENPNIKYPPPPIMFKIAPRKENKYEK